MSYEKNIFKNLKSFYELAIENFNLINNQQQNMIEFFLQTQPDLYRDNLMKVYKEWLKNSEIALNEYKNMVIKGLDYLEENYNKISKAASNKNKGK
jgi:hypothetical protein